MSIFCVSDLHLADRGFRDNFAVEGRERDSTSSWTTWRPKAANCMSLAICSTSGANPSRIVVAYLDLLTRLDKMQAVYVVGNHDAPSRRSLANRA